jgi:hypothetical protein
VKKNGQEKASSPLRQPETARARSPRLRTKKRSLAKPAAIFFGFVVLASLLVWKILEGPAAAAYFSTIMTSAKAFIHEKKTTLLAKRTVPVPPRTIAKEPAPPATNGGAERAANGEAATNGVTKAAESSTLVASNDQPNAQPESPRVEAKKTVVTRTVSVASNTKKSASRSTIKPETRAPVNGRLPDKTSVPSKNGVLKAPVIPPGMVLVKEAEFVRGDVFGDGNPNEKPAHRVRVASFLIGRDQSRVFDLCQSHRRKHAGVDEPGEQISLSNRHRSFLPKAGDGVVQPRSSGGRRLVAGCREVLRMALTKGSAQISFANGGGMGAGGARRQ